jgi:hypothetical protein
LSEETIVGQPVSGEFCGVLVLGSYGCVWVIETSYVPAGYAAVMASGGPNSPSNVIASASTRTEPSTGFSNIPGSDWSPYPIIGSFHLR